LSIRRCPINLRSAFFSTKLAFFYTHFSSLSLLKFFFFPLRPWGTFFGLANVFSLLSALICFGLVPKIFQGTNLFPSFRRSDPLPLSDAASTSICRFPHFNLWILLFFLFFSKSCPKALLIPPFLSFFSRAFPLKRFYPRRLVQKRTGLYPPPPPRQASVYGPQLSFFP